INVLYFHLAHLLKLPVMAMFVFDGPKRPAVKHGKQVRPKPHWLTHGLKVLVVAFGFHSHQAPGEAEAELAWLSQNDIIDAVLTDDSDCLVFGAKCVIHNLNIKMDSNMVAIYTAKSISEHPDVSLMESGMILFTLLAGGDYDQVSAIGLRGCGTHVTYGLARSGLGDSLLHAAQSLGLPDFLHFLIGWCIQLHKELLTNASRYLTQKQLALTRKVPTTFPRYHTLFQYATEDTLPNASHWMPGQLNITKLTSLYELYFTWGMPSGIMANFHGHIYAGACIQRLSSPVHMVSCLSTHLSGMIKDGPFTPANVLWIERARSGPGDVPSYCVELSTYLLITALLSGLHGIRKEVPENSGPHPLTFVWIPASILHMALPVLVKQFEVKKAQLVSNSISCIVTLNLTCTLV
ncbi:PIN domain-like protein, partial [Tricholoma matsutake]